MWPPQKDIGEVGVCQLQNGVTLALAPAPSDGVASIAVHARVGFRSEPDSSPGLAHLLEHLLFQDGRTGGPAQHIARVERLGGIAGARTRHDYTEFFDVVPRGSLSTAIALEFERLANPLFTMDGIRTQTGVIEAELSEEVQGKVLGGFPWTYLPQAMYSSWGNTHDGYGDVANLGRVTPDDVDSFFDAAYSPSNLVITVTADNLSAAELDTFRGCFGSLPSRAALAPTTMEERLLEQNRHIWLPHPNCPAPVTAAGLRLPTPQSEPSLYRGCAALPALLRLEGTVGVSEARCGWFGRPLDTLNPDAWIAIGPSTGDSPGEHLAERVRALLSRWCDSVISQEKLELLGSRLRLDHDSSSQELSYPGRRIGATLALFDDLTILDRASPERRITTENLRDAAEFLLRQPIATVSVSE